MLVTSDMLVSSSRVANDGTYSIRKSPTAPVQVRLSCYKRAVLVAIFERKVRAAMTPFGALFVIIRKRRQKNLSKSGVYTGIIAAAFDFLSLRGRRQRIGAPSTERQINARDRSRSETRQNLLRNLIQESSVTDTTVSRSFTTTSSWLGHCLIIVVSLVVVLLTMMEAAGAAPAPTAMAVLSSPLQCHAVRIPPTADLVPSLLEAAKQAMANSEAKSAFVMTAVGSLSKVTLRMAATDKEDTLDVRTFHRHFEIVSLVGTFSSEGGGKHLHMSVSNSEGAVLGGHLVAGTVYTTLELVLGTMPTVSFTRQMDANTGYQELTVSQEKGN